MIMPSKHINFSQSLLGFGSYLLQKLEAPKTIDDLWNEYLYDYNNEMFTAYQTFDNLILTLIFLYSINTIEEKNGIIKKCN
jgi:hypothetical protein